MKFDINMEKEPCELETYNDEDEKEFYADLLMEQQEQM